MVDQVVDIQKGTIFRARGGPTFRGEPVGAPGLYRAIGSEPDPDRDRLHIIAYPVDRHGVQTGGTMLIYAKGESYTLPELPEWVCHPYVLTTKTKMVREDVKATRGSRIKRKPKTEEPMTQPDEPKLTPVPVATDGGGARNVVAKMEKSRPAGSMTMLDAAEAILKREGKPMHVKELIPAMAEAGLWQTTKGKTPWATLWAAMPRDARFIKTGPGVFGLK